MQEITNTAAPTSPTNDFRCGSSLLRTRRFRSPQAMKGIAKANQRTAHWGGKIPSVMCIACAGCESNPSMISKNTKPPTLILLFIILSTGVYLIPRILELVSVRPIKIPGYTRTRGYRFLSLAAKLLIHEEPTHFSLWAGFLTSGSSYLPTFPSISDSGYSAFVAGHSGGSVTDSHRFPSIPVPGLPINKHEHTGTVIFRQVNHIVHLW